MTQKTVIKLLLSRFAPLSVEMQKAVIADQSVINNSETLDVTYVDHGQEPVDKEAERMAILIENASSLEELESYSQHVQAEQMDLFTAKKEQLNGKRK